MVKGFYYTLEDEKIIAYMKLPLEVKLKWLEEINFFNRLVLTDKQKEISDKLKKGEI